MHKKTEKIDLIEINPIYPFLWVKKILVQYKKRMHNLHLVLSRIVILHFYSNQLLLMVLK